ncbi:MAG: DoxX family protein [Proteobacteria bacterium]|nr:DoxX family protein [Pseudomonadota bacterium]
MTGEPRLLIPAMGRLYEALAPVTEPLIRLCAGLSMAAHGYLILFGARDANIAFFAQAGFHPAAFWATAAGITQFCGGLCLAAGLLTRLAAVPVLVFLLVAIQFHAANGFYWNKLGIEYPLFWAIAVLHFLVRGGGRWSLDHAIGREF